MKFNEKIYIDFTQKTLIKKMLIYALLRLLAILFNYETHTIYMIKTRFYI